LQRLPSLLPPRRFYDREVYVRLVCPRLHRQNHRWLCRCRTDGSHRFGPLSGLHPRHRPGLATRASPPGVHGPFNGVGLQVRIIPGFSSPGSFRLRGFTPPWRFAPCTLCGLAAAAIPGVPRSKVRSSARRAALPQRTRLLAAEVPASRTLRNTR
jgi:hypothetical protein